jgi:hypothetical protein
MKKSEAHAVISEELEEGNISTFMAHIGKYPYDNAWYMDNNTIDHMINQLDWFAFFNDMARRFGLR